MYKYVPQIIVSSISNFAELYAHAYIIEVSSFVRDMPDLNNISGMGIIPLWAFFDRWSGMW
jgi:hypothetical protein